MVLHSCPRESEEDFVELLGSWEFPAQAQSVACARIEVIELLEELEVPQTYEAAIIVDELVSNVVVHAKTMFELEVERWQNGIKIIVRDLSIQEPSIQALDPLSESGRGLFMIDSIADEWGHHVHESGKCIWADIVLNF